MEFTEQDRESIRNNAEPKESLDLEFWIYYIANICNENATLIF